MLLTALLLSASLCAAAAPARERINFNRGWRFTLGDPSEARLAAFDDGAWAEVNLPHSFSMPYFMWKSVYNGYGWYRKTFDLPKLRAGRRVFVEFEGVFIRCEVFVNGQKAGSHTGGYTGFVLDLTPYVKRGRNVLAVRVDNLWQPDVAPRAGDHQFSGGIYRDVLLHFTDALHTAWCGTFVTTPEVSADAAALKVETEVRNDGRRERTFTLHTDILSPEGRVVASTATKATLAAGRQAVIVQRPGPVASPRLWHPDTPHLYKAVTTIRSGGKTVDRTETPFGIRYFEWSADEGFFLNGKHLYLLGANVHQDHAGWGDAVTNEGFRRDVRMMKACGFNMIRGSHYPHDPAFARACDELGMLFFPENAFWGMGGGSGDRNGWGTPSSSCYPPDPAHQAAFDRSVLTQLRELIRINRNSPSVVAWSMSNEPFFTDASTDACMKRLLNAATDSARAWDGSRLVAIGGSQRKGVDKLGKGQIAFYNGDGAGFLKPGVPSMVSEYGSVTTHRPGSFAPGWGDLRDGYERPAWRGGQAVWCGFDHGTVGGTGLAVMGLVDYFRLPKRAWYWYREAYAKGIRNPAEPKWPEKGVPAKLALTADKTTIAAPDGTDDVHLTVSVLDAQNRPLSNELPVVLSVVEGPGEFPTGGCIRFMPPSDDEASDIAMRDGKAAIEFRSYHAGQTVIEASAEGLQPARITVTTLGEPTWESAGRPKAPARPYRRFIAAPKGGTGAEMLLALNRPSFASSTAAAATRAAANDDNAQTAWRAEEADGTAWWKLDLEASYDLSAIEIVLPEKGGARFVVEVSTDGRAWRTVAGHSTQRPKEKTVGAKGDLGRSIRFVRCRFFDAGAALSEVKVGGVPAAE